MKDQPNLDAVSALKLDYIGNIFFSKSPRNLNTVVNTPVTKVGVFVNEELKAMADRIADNGLSVIQLHGGESNAICKAVKALGVEVWKVFSVGENFNFSELHNYPDADMFLFDTKTENHGGAGKKFNWSVLDQIDRETPKAYFLAGGIGPEDVQEIKNLELDKLVGLDLNSKFEIEPGIKDVQLLKEFLNELRK